MRNECKDARNYSQQTTGGADDEITIAPLLVDAVREQWRDIIIGNNRACLGGSKFASGRPDLLEHTLADKYMITVPTMGDALRGSPFSYCVGSQCFRPRGCVVS